MNFKLLKQKDFMLLMLGKLVSLIGSDMQNFALSLYVLKITGSAAQFASVLAITLIPRLILGPLAGVLVDWLDRKKTIVYLDMVNGLMIGAYAAIYMINGSLSLSSIYIIAISLSLTSLLFQPAITTVIPSIVKKEELMDANGINTLIMNVGSLAAPMAAGILFGFYGLSIILVINAISFILSSISEMFINIPRNSMLPDKINVKSFLHDFSQGINFIRERRMVVTIITLACIVNFAFPPIGSIGLVYISKQILKITDSQYGFLESILVVSMLVSPFVASRISKKYSVGKIFFGVILITSILIAIMAVIPSSLYLNLFKTNLVPYVSLIIVIFMIGLVVSVGNIALGTMFQKEVPLEIMGRVVTVMSTVTMAAMPLGQILFGFLFDKVDTWICVLLSASIFFATVVIFRKNLWDNETSGNVIDKPEESAPSSKGSIIIENEELSVKSPQLANLIDDSHPDL